MDRIMEQLRAYCPWNEQEEADCAELLRGSGRGSRSGRGRTARPT